MPKHQLDVIIPLVNVKLKNDNITFIILSVDNFRNSLLIFSGGFQILGPWAIFYMRGPACERREQLGVWGALSGGGALKFFRL